MTGSPEHPLNAIEIESVSKRFAPLSALAARWLGGAAMSPEEAEETGQDDAEGNKPEEPQARPDVLALDRVDLRIAPGERVGIVGAPGSGKTTLLRIIAGTMLPSEGLVRRRGTLVFVSELRSPVFPELTGRQHLALFEVLLGLPEGRIVERTDAILDFAGMRDHIDRKVKHYSKGMFSRLGVSLALNCDPDILLADESLAAGDPRFRVECAAKIEELVANGTTLLLASQKPSQIENNCDRAIWLADGRVVADGSSSSTLAYFVGVTELGLPAAFERTGGEANAQASPSPDEDTSAAPAGDETENVDPGGSDVERAAEVRTSSTAVELPVGSGAVQADWIERSAQLLKRRTEGRVPAPGETRVVTPGRINRLQLPKLGTVYAIEATDPGGAALDTIRPAQDATVRIGVAAFDADVEIRARLELHVDGQIAAVADIPAPFVAPEAGCYVLEARLGPVWSGLEVRRILWKIMARIFFARRGQPPEQMEIGVLQLLVLGDEDGADPGVEQEAVVEPTKHAALPSWAGPIPSGLALYQGKPKHMREPLLRPLLDWSVERIAPADMPVAAVAPEPPPVDRDPIEPPERTPGFADGSAATAADVDECASDKAASAPAAIPERSISLQKLAAGDAGVRSRELAHVSLDDDTRKTRETGTVVVIKPRAAGTGKQLGALWAKRALLPFLLVHSVRTAYANAILGFNWLLIRPLVMTMAGAVLVGDVFGVSTPPIPFVLFILAGLVPWLVLQRGAVWGTKSLVRSRALLRRYRFPRIFLPLSSLGPTTVEVSVAAVILVAAAIYFGPITGFYYLPVRLEMLWSIAAFAWCMLLVLSLTAVTSVLNSFARDTIFVMGYAVTIGSMITPVFYPRTALPEPWRELMLLNPATAPVELFRWALLDAYPPTAREIMISLALLAVMLAGGLYFFHRWEGRGAEAM